MRVFVPVHPTDLLIMLLMSLVVVGPPVLVIYYTGDWFFLLAWSLLVGLVAICDHVCPRGMGGGE